MFFLMDVLEPLPNRGADTPLNDGGSIQLRSSRDSVEEWGMDWLHESNPMNEPEKVTEWMLLKLVEKLEEELRQLRADNGNVPPIE